MDNWHAAAQSMPSLSGMDAYSLELTSDAGETSCKAFRAVKLFDSTVVMCTTLQVMRERKPFDIHLDRADRAEVLRRLIELLEELERLGISYELSANNVPRSSHLWEPSTLIRSDVVSELAAGDSVDEERRRAAELMKNFILPEPPRSRQLLDQRWRDIEFSDLLAPEQNYIYIWAMRAELNIGCFPHYLTTHLVTTLCRPGPLWHPLVLATFTQFCRTRSGCSKRPEHTQPIVDPV